MKTLWQTPAREEILDRLGHLQPDSVRRWGTMTAEQMLAHVGDQLRLALGDIEARPPRGPLANAVGRYLSVHLLPWPNGKLKSPREAFTTRPATWDADKRAVADLITRFAAAEAQAAWPPHSMLGRMRGRDWAVLSYRHLDHHLRQFSC